jgi:hypothetical protein
VLAWFDKLAHCGYFGYGGARFYESPALHKELVQLVIGWLVSFFEGNRTEKSTHEGVDFVLAYRGSRKVAQFVTFRFFCMD